MYTRFENGSSENSTQKLLTKYSTEENYKRRLHSRPLAQFFPIRSTRPANNIYILCWCLRRLYFLVPSRKSGYGLTYFRLEYNNFFSILFLLPCTCKVVSSVVTYRDGACLKISKCVNMVDRPTRLRNTWFGFLAFVIFLLSRVCL